MCTLKICMLLISHFNISHCVFLKYDWPDVTDNKAICEKMIKYEFNYLPGGLFNRMQVNLCL